MTWQYHGVHRSKLVSENQDIICPFHCVGIWTNSAKAMVVWKGFIIFLAPIKAAGTELP